MSKATIKPLGYYVLVKMREVEEKTDSGIIVSTSKDLQREKLGQSVGTVLAIGPMAFRGLANGCNSPDEWGVAVGDVIEFNSYDGKIPKAGKDDSLRLILDQHVIAKVE